MTSHVAFSKALLWNKKGNFEISLTLVTCGPADSSDSVNTLRARQNGRYFADNIFKCIFLNENVWIAIKISLKFVPKGSINNIPALLQMMAWRRAGHKPLSEPTMVSLTTHICVTLPQWVNGLTLSRHYLRAECWISLLNIYAFQATIC